MTFPTDENDKYRPLNAATEARVDAVVPEQNIETTKEHLRLFQYFMTAPQEDESQLFRNEIDDYKLSFESPSNDFDFRK